MKDKKNIPLIEYYGCLAGMALFLIGGVLSGVKALDALFNGGNYYITGIAAIICIGAVLVLNQVQIRLRDEVEYDEFGQSRKHGDFSKLSKAERQKIEEAKMLDSERILPSSELKSMTHKGSSDPIGDLEALIGLPQVKKMVGEFAAQMEFDKIYKKDKKNSEAKSYHMCFSGPPGTAKTTTARLMAGLMYKYGVIKENKCIETDGNIFHGNTSSDATLKVQKILRAAYGGVLFIDEAYSLMDGHSGGNSEVIATLIKEMEDNRSGIVIILAGYENEMKALIESNPGFKSRIQQFYYFESYNMDDLKAIFKSMAAKEGYDVSEMAYDRFEELIEPMRASKHFGNGRTVRNILQASIIRHKVNVIADKTKYSEVYETQKEVKLHGKKAYIKEKKTKVSMLLYEDIDIPQTI